MSIFPWKIVRKTELPSDKLVDKIKEILYPPLELREDQNIKYHIDYSVDRNLDAVYTDLIDDHNDIVTQKTLLTVINKLVEVRRILEAYSEFDPEAQYLLVENDKFPDKEIFAKD